MKKSLVLLVALCAGAYAEGVPSSFASENRSENVAFLGSNRRTKVETQTTTVTTTKPVPEKTVTCDANSIAKIGGVYSYLWLTPEDGSTFRGSLGGLQASYEFRPKNCIYEGLKFSWKQGATEQADNSRFILDFDAQERIGYTMAGKECSWVATAFTGFGYRYLGQELKQPGFSTVEFNYSEFYVPVGIMGASTIKSCVTLGLNLTWMPQVFPTLHIDPLNGANWTIDRKLVNFLVEAPISFFLTQKKNMSLELKPFFEYWQDGKTTAVTQNGIALNVPGNTYLFAGAEVNFGWMF